MVQEVKVPDEQTHQDELKLQDSTDLSKNGWQMPNGGLIILTNTLEKEIPV